MWRRARRRFEPTNQSCSRHTSQAGPCRRPAATETQFYRNFNQIWSLRQSCRAQHRCPRQLQLLLSLKHAGKEDCPGLPRASPAAASARLSLHVMIDETGCATSLLVFQGFWLIGNVDLDLDFLVPARPPTCITLQRASTTCYLQRPLVYACGSISGGAFWNRCRVGNDRGRAAFDAEG